MCRFTTGFLDDLHPAGTGADNPHALAAKVHRCLRPVCGVVALTLEVAGVHVGRRVGAGGEAGTEQEELALAEAKLAMAELMLRKKMMELMHEIRYLDAQKTAAQADLLSRELALDKVRLQYEMEIRAQIGAANAAVAKAMERLKRLDYERAYAFEAFDALTGYLFGDGHQHVGTAGSGHSGD